LSVGESSGRIGSACTSSAETFDPATAITCPIFVEVSLTPFSCPRPPGPPSAVRRAPEGRLAIRISLGVAPYPHVAPSRSPRACARSLRELRCDDVLFSPDRLGLHLHSLGSVELVAQQVRVRDRAQGPRVVRRLVAAGAQD